MNKAKWSEALSCTSPPEVISGTDVKAQMYCHLLCALRNSDLIDGIRAPCALGLVRAFSLLESKWEQICDDLENGFPGMQITDPAMRESVAKVLGGPQPDLSKRFRSIFEEKNWDGIVSKLWSNVRFIKCVTTGSMKQYYSKLKYYAGEVLILGGDYFASECPVAAYFEFLPFDLNEGSVDGNETVNFSDVKVGKTYEVVVTTYRGFYRYRLGDIVRVVGFHNSSPEVEFVMRAPNNAYEVITEKDLMSAMESFQLVMINAVAVEIVEFASFLDMESSPKQLKIFLEVKEGCVLLQEEKLQESSLGGLYKVQRDRSEIGPLLVYIVKPGSFDRIFQMAVENGAQASQYKPPKIIRNSKVISAMESSALVTVCLDSLD
uniref:Indole-3-acetic acid-amido synthetase GH3.6 n=1 Tax=Manihot esculenta TaxID=3983 RepID=A0A2C9WMU5_MANES